MENRTGIFTNAIIWFGVAISVSEIEAGIQIATASPLNSIWIPLMLGHLLGGILLFFVGFIGAKLRVNAMQTTESSFGKYGSKFFAALNVMQLIAWVAVLNAQGTVALLGIDSSISFPIISLILAVLVAIWVYVGLQKSQKITTIVMFVLTTLLIILSAKMFFAASFDTSNALLGSSHSLGFWNIFEISIAMPISWLPVISDYTKDAKNPINSTLVSAVAYTFASLWMYVIGIEVVGMGVDNIAQAILLAGLGIPGVIIMVLSTVTTNFLATNSAGESVKAIYTKLNPKTVGVIVSALSAIIAISGIMNHYIDFLYLISSVFAPMAAVLMVSFYLLKDKNIPWQWNIFAWFTGFAVYQFTVGFDSILFGPSLLAIIVSSAIAYAGVLIKRVLAIIHRIH